MKKITIATAQMIPSKKISENLKIILRLILQAKKERARFILFPEGALTGYAGSEIASTDDIHIHQLTQALQQIGIAAAENKIFVAVGTAYFHKKTKDWTNSLVVFNDKGKKKCLYHKMALTRSDEKYFIQGQTHPTFAIDKVIFGCQICFDVRFPENYRAYFKKGVHIIAHAYHQTGLIEIAQQRRDLMTAFQRVRSSENAIYSITSNVIGHNKGKDQWIPTMVINPRGDIIAQLPSHKTGVLVTTINADELQENIVADIRKYSAIFLKLKTLPQRELTQKQKK